MAELARLDALLATLARDEGGALVVHGAAGIGKTTLLEALVERCDGAITVLRACGAETEAQLAFSALTDIARRAGGPLAVVLAARDPWYPPERIRLPDLLVGPVDDCAAAQLLRRRAPELAPPVAAAITQAAAGNPLALVELPGQPGAAGLVGLEGQRSRHGSPGLLREGVRRKLPLGTTYHYTRSTTSICRTNFQDHLVAGNDRSAIR
jgi:hypothetical protein